MVPKCNPGYAHKCNKEAVCSALSDPKRLARRYGGTPKPKLDLESRSKVPRRLDNRRKHDASDI